MLAVGEAGIDLHKCASDLEMQKMVFNRHVELAFEHRLPLIVHCRSGSKGNSEDICLNIITEVHPEHTLTVFNFQVFSR